MSAAADELLARLGVDPRAQRGKTKAARAQFASEHQAIYYAHNDTDSRHLQIMLNRVHGEHGALLPSSNDQIKASKWAEAFSKRYGTEHATPDRQINNEARENGEYVKGKRRTRKRQFELERAAKVANDNDIVGCPLTAEPQGCRACSEGPQYAVPPGAGLGCPRPLPPRTARRHQTRC